MFGLENWLIPAVLDEKFANGIELGDSIPDLQCEFPRTDQISSVVFSPSLSSSGDRNAILKYVNQLLLEEDDSENTAITWQNDLALQATEKSLYDVLREKHSPRPNHNPPLISRPCDLNTSTTLNTRSNGIGDLDKFMSPCVEHNSDDIIKYPTGRFSSSSCSREASYGTIDLLFNSFQVLDSSKGSQVILSSPLPTVGDHKNYYHAGKRNGPEENNHPQSQSRENGSHYRDDHDDCSIADRSNKKLASIGEVTNEEQSDMFDKVLLCSCLEPRFDGEFLSCLCDKGTSNGPKMKVKKNKKPSEMQKREVVDLMTLLTQCSQAVSKNNISAANELLKKVKQHSSPQGDSIERMAHYVGKALEARLTGMGRASDASLLVRRLSPTETLKTYLAYLLPCPFKKMSNFFANKWIWKTTENASNIHIIDFGIIHGFQWPHLIQHLSSRPGGPPNLRITGVDFPQPGFRPSERTEETGRLLAYYCKRFNIPFEYNAIAKRWETIKLDDFKIRKKEVLIVNCLYRLRYIPDETVRMNSPRDAVLGLIRELNPDLFIHGIINGSYNAPFFLTRFRDLLLQFYMVFDMFDSILPREDEGRMLFEREAMGRTTMSVIACEGIDRVVRPETYKQWQLRNSRARLEQVPLDGEIVKDVKEKVKSGYHKDFVVDVDSDWMLLGWKGRIFNAISCWKPPKQI